MTSAEAGNRSQATYRRRPTPRIFPARRRSGAKCRTARPARSVENPRLPQIEQQMPLAIMGSAARTLEVIHITAHPVQRHDQRRHGARTALIGKEAAHAMATHHTDPLAGRWKDGGGSQQNSPKVLSAEAEEPFLFQNLRESRRHVSGAPAAVVIECACAPWLPRFMSNAMRGDTFLLDIDTSRW